MTTLAARCAALSPDPTPPWRRGAVPQAARLNTPEFYSAYNGRMNPVAYYSGVSFSEPSDKYTEENKQTSWYRDTH